METKFTNGPWQVNGSHVYGPDPERKLLAQGCNQGSDEKFVPMVDNLRLIAAAPEMYEALKKAVYELNAIRARDGVPYTHDGWKASVDEEYFSSVVDESFAALAKAEGR